MQQTHKCGEQADTEGILSTVSCVPVPKYSGETSSHSTAC